MPLDDLNLVIIQKICVGIVVLALTQTFFDSKFSQVHCSLRQLFLNFLGHVLPALSSVCE
jgi:hypothetical protein